MACLRVGWFQSSRLQGILSRDLAPGEAGQPAAAGARGSGGGCADGKTTYGIIGGGDIRAAAAEELVGITPIVEKKRGRYTDSGR